MSMPNEENLRVAQNILKYALGSLDEKITYRPADANDPLGDFNYGLMAFTDSDWASSLGYSTQSWMLHHHAGRRMHSSQE